MLPYGWDSPAGEQIVYRYRSMIRDVGANYHQWVNPHDHNGFEHADKVGAVSPMTGRPKPNSTEMPQDFWQQQTIVDVESLSEVLDVPMAAIGAKRREGVWINPHKQWKLPRRPKPPHNQRLQKPEKSRKRKRQRDHGSTVL